MTKVILGTATDGRPTLDIPKGKRGLVWGYHFGLEGPKLVKHPTTTTGKPAKTPAWMDQTALLIWKLLNSFHERMAPRADAVEILRHRDRALISLAGKVLLYEAPGVRKAITTMANALQRESMAQGTPADLAQIALETSQALSAVLYRLAPPKRVAGDEGPGPTRATVERLEPDPVEMLLISDALSDAQKSAALDIRRIYRALTQELDAKAGSLEPSGEKSRSGFTQPLAKLSGEIETKYLESFRPWSQIMAQRPWWWMPHRAMEAPKRGSGATFMDICLRVLSDGVAVEDSDNHYRLPPGRSIYVLRLALNEYGVG